MPQRLPEPIRQRLVRWLCLAALCLATLGLAPQARADALPEREVRAVRAVVEAQLKAMAQHDARKAFSYATPAIRSQFADAASFMAMVQSAYPMVVRPVATAFFRPETTDEGVLQVVQLRDREGRLWLASYLLQRQPDQRWRINGCVVAPDSGKLST